MCRRLVRPREPHWRGCVHAWHPTSPAARAILRVRAGSRPNLLLPFCPVAARNAQPPGIVGTWQTQGKELSLRGAIRDARTYELMTVFSPDVAEDEIQATIEAVVGYISGASGENVEFNRDSPWGRRRLAYAIRHASRDVRDGFYTLFHFEVAPHRVIDIEREIKLNDRIMRYLLTQYTPRPVDESATAEAPSEASAEATSGEDQNDTDNAAEENSVEAVAESGVPDSISTETSGESESTESPDSSDASEDSSTEEA